MLINFNDMLATAYREKYAIGSFNAYNYETIRGIIAAAKEMEAPSVIVAFGQKYLNNMHLNDVVSVTQSLARAFDLPVCLHLDHCRELDIVWAAIQAGFSSIMFDGSMLPYEENVAKTKLVCDIAHACGVSVEAELGSIASGDHSHEGFVDDREVYTTPELAKDFIEKTAVDALAVSIGTVHGVYKGKPNIRVDILKSINESVQSPLVLHGGSGTPEDKIRECIQNGICKINVNTEISMFTVQKIKEKLSEEMPHLSVLAKYEEDMVKEVVKKSIALFNN